VSALRHAEKFFEKNKKILKTSRNFEKKVEYNKK
jgi:hypothetical protein